MPAVMVRSGVSRSNVSQALVELRWFAEARWLGPALMVVMGLGGAGCGKSARDFDTSSGDVHGTEPDAAAIGPDASAGEPDNGSTSEPNATSAGGSEPTGGANPGSSPSSGQVPTSDVPSDAISSGTAGVISPSDGTGETSNVITDTTDGVPGDTGSGSDEPGDTTGEGTSAQTGPDTTAPRCNENILLNGGFESGKDHWAFTSNYGAFEQRVHPVIVENGHESLTDYSVTAYSGTQFAFLGDIPDDEYMGYGLRLAQPVYIPDGALGLVLKGHIWVSSNEDPEGAEYDMGYVELQPPGDEEKVLQFKFWTNRNPMTEWTEINEYIEGLDLVRGQTVDFVVQAVMDATTPTRFWFDDLELIVVCPE